jgi:hypothetical protein
MTMAFLQNAVQQGGFSSPQKAGEYGHGNQFIHKFNFPCRILHIAL